MNKQDIKNILQEARATHNSYINDGQVLLDGINLDRLEEPVPLEECKMTHWCISNLNNISEFSWFKDLKESHANLHEKFNVLFHESMRKYNPKTFDQLSERFEDLKSEAKIFDSKLDEAESEIDNMPEEGFTESNVEESSSILQKIDIVDYKENDIDDNKNKIDNKINENSHEETSIDIIDIDNGDKNKHGILNSDEQTHYEVETNNSNKKLTNADSVLSPTDNKEEQHSSESMRDKSETIKKHISLKEQNIAQLQQQKELSQLELSHLEETHKLTLQSAKQLETSYGLKQQEIELDQKDNNQLVSFKNTIRKQTLDNLSDISQTKRSLKQDIEDLETKISEDQIKQESDKSSVTIAKQFEELKLNKHKDLEVLQNHLQTRKIDLKQLKEQVSLLEEEIDEMESDISKKNQDMTTLKEKEQIKNEEFAAQLAQYERIKIQHESSIKDKQIELDALLLKDQEKQKQLETVDFQMTELYKKNELLEQSNSESLSDLEQQKQVNREKVEEINRLKFSKETEIIDIEKSIRNTKESLAEMKSSQPDNQHELTTAD